MVAAKTWPMLREENGAPFSLVMSVANSSMRAVIAAESCAMIVGALGGGHPRPRPEVEGLAGGGDGAVDVGRGRLGHAADQLLGGGRDHVERVGAGRLDPLAADEELVVGLHVRSPGGQVRGADQVLLAPASASFLAHG